MLLQELFGDSKLDASKLKIKSDATSWEASYKIGDDNLVVGGATEGPGHTWRIRFSVNNYMSITGGGNQFDIFSTVVTLLKQFMDEKKPKAIGLSASEKSRASLYRKMLKRVKPDWDFIEQKDHHKTLFFGSANGKIPVVWSKDFPNAVEIDAGEATYFFFIEDGDIEVNYRILEDDFFKHSAVMEAANRALAMIFNKAKMNYDGHVKVTFSQASSDLDLKGFVEGMKKQFTYVSELDYDHVYVGY